MLYLRAIGLLMESLLLVVFTAASQPFIWADVNVMIGVSLYRKDLASRVRGIARALDARK